MYCRVCGNELPNTRFCPSCGAPAGDGPASNAPNPDYRFYPTGVSHLDYVTTLILAILLGGLGAHRFYAGKIGTAVLWLLTGGCFGIGWIVDIVLVATNKFTDSNGNYIIN